MRLGYKGVANFIFGKISYEKLENVYLILKMYFLTHLLSHWNTFQLRLTPYFFQNLFRKYNSETSLVTPQTFLTKMYFFWHKLIRICTSITTLERIQRCISETTSNGSFLLWFRDAPMNFTIYYSYKYKPQKMTYIN